ncbi:laccase [Moniliophthora roreri MCA 2997]|uniref:laccase n=1 Tax=Moniliophthora roreri (strain MCA 2997) TaxID=1381753 RepID=V2XJ15_MONRO|nr:laccase [Moniliophthora roreri MCA 2997]
MKLMIAKLSCLSNRSRDASTIAPFILLALTARTYAIGPETDLVVSPDGFSRSAILAGGATIGPLIVGNKAGGDTSKINVVNQLNDDMLQSTNIHWHGFFQAYTNWADGPALVNQCPIPHGTSFLYEFPVRVWAGTFLHHSHLSTQRSDGLRGLIVIYDLDDPLKICTMLTTSQLLLRRFVPRFNMLLTIFNIATQYCDGLRGPIIIYDLDDDPFKDIYDVDDKSTVITLADWYHEKAKTLVASTPDSTVINGLGRCSRWKKGDATEIAVIQVQRGKRYRMRPINTACGPDYFFSVDNHDMMVIEADVHICHRDYNPPPALRQVNVTPSFLKSIGLSETTVTAASMVPPENFVAVKKLDNMLNEADLHPIAREKSGAPGQPFLVVWTTLCTCTSAIRATTSRGICVAFPVPLQVLSGAQLPAGSVYELPASPSIEISIVGGGVKGFEYPMHLHGHAFDVVRVAGSDTCNYESPVRRDVVNF